MVVVVNGGGVLSRFPRAVLTRARHVAAQLEF